MKAIFDLVRKNKPAASKYATTNLQDVHLESLPKLEQVFNQREGILGLNNLHKIWVQYCQRLESIFSVPVTKTLENKLEELVVSDCSQLREIVVEQEDAPEFSFLKLTTIKFLRLPKFKAFYPGTCKIEFSALLNNLSIEKCDKLEPFREDCIPETVINNLKSIQIESRHAKSSTNYDYRKDNLEELHLSRLKDTKILYSFLYSNPNIKDLWLSDGSFLELVPHKRLTEIESLGVVPQLKSLKLTDIRLLWNIGFERDPILQRIESLVFQNCRNLNTIAPSNVFLSNLTKLEVVDCDGLEYLISPSTARSLGQLNTMKVINCGALGEIVSEKGQKGREEHNRDKDDDIIFKQLTTIELVSLKNLESFCCSESCAFQFPSLERFVVSACPKLKSFSQQEDMKPPKLQKVYVVHEKEKVEPHWTSNLQDTIQDIFNKKIFFKGMEQLSVSDHLDHLQPLWQSNEIPLQEKMFNNLKTLKLNGCKFEPYAMPSNVLFSFKNLKELEVDNCKNLTGIFQMNDTKMIKETPLPLKKLTLKALRNVTHVWQPEKQGFLSFKNLQILTVNRCKDLRTLFPIALARDLKKLEELEVRNCDALPNIVEAAEAGTVEQLEFPCLTTLALVYLPNLTDFFSHKFTLECPELNCLSVYQCNDQLELFQSQQEENQNSTSTAKQPLFMNIKDISKMESLTLSWRCTQAFSSWLRNFKDENLESLNGLYLIGDDDSSVPIELFEKSPNLEILELAYCPDETILKKIFPSHDDGANNRKVLGKLKELHLSNLDELESISGAEYLSKQQLRLLHFYQCPKLTTIVLQSISFLKELRLNCCSAMLRLFTSSTAKMLIHLEELHVESCKSVKEIVGEEQQSVTEDVIEFKKLERIKLQSLGRLECFYSGNATLKLPSLIQLDTDYCPKMKVFSHGKVSLSRRIQVSYNWTDDSVFHHDLNVAAVWRFLVEERLTLGRQPELKDLWLGKLHTQGVYSSGFNLKHLVVEGCDEFFTNAILPSHLLPFLTGLEVLEVRRCNSVEAIFEVKDTPTNVVIPLKTMILEKLPTLRHVWSKNPEGKLSHPDLEEVIVDECAILKSLFPESVDKGNIQRLEVKNCAELVNIFSMDEVAKDANKQVSIFPTLSCLKLWNLPNLECAFSLSYALFPSYSLPCLHKLKELVVGKCGSFETIFDVKDAPTRATTEEDTNMITTSVIPLTMKLTLEHLPTLRHIWNKDPEGNPSLPCLEEVVVNECQSLTSLFPASVPVSELEKLDVRNCEELIEIVTTDEADEADNEVTDKIVIFPRLISLTLHNLPNLACIDAAVKIGSIWPSLTKLDVYPSKLLTKFATYSPAKVMIPHLARLSVDKDGVMMLDEGLLHLMDIAENIFDLKLQGFNDIESDELPFDFFPQEPLPKIQILTVADSAFTEIFPPQMPEIILSQLLLKQLELRNLYKLESIGLEHTWVSSSNLTWLKVEGCASLKYLLTSSTAKCLVQLQELHISNCEALESVIVSYQPHDDDDEDDVITLEWLKVLSLSELPKMECFYKGNKSTLKFPSLKEVKVTECNSLEYMFTFSTATSLKYLREMEISKCGSLGTVVLAEEEVRPHGYLTFGYLKKLSLSELPTLRSFFAGQSTLKFTEYGVQVIITQCENIKPFSHGGVQAPHLRSVEIDRVICLKDNLNATVRHSNLRIE
ncbi:hypothetical protein PIB30_059419 [Stylosanthes scabra]|uniref:Disease resistance protein At4g27190-like leucine-rich repeats domain-containing protein n=1 Tax=Stylosanthes scabra TaxID=79078 RepID=A0ABU6QM21_9FABA|nr:hypothetical protein [Stylosanthes scabra]